MRAATRTRIRTVLFDVGGTLLRVKLSVGTVYAAAARDHGFEVSIEELDRNFRAAWKKGLERSRARDYSCSDEILREEWFRIVCDTFGASVPRERMPALFDDLYDRFASAAAWELAPGVKGTLDHLRAAGVRLGIVSNWDSRLRAMLEDLGLGRAFDFLVISYDVGVEKPHPDIFESALDLAGSAPAETLLVGDSYEADIQPAERHGLTTLWVTSRDERDARAPGYDRPWMESFPHDAISFWRAWIG